MRRYWVPFFCISSVLSGTGGWRTCCLPRTDSTRATMGASVQACGCVWAPIVNRCGDGRLRAGLWLCLGANGEQVGPWSGPCLPRTDSSHARTGASAHSCGWWG